MKQKQETEKRTEKRDSQKELTSNHLAWYDPFMPRERRIEYAGAVYHVMARGDRREDIVLDQRDRVRFEETLTEVVEKSGWVLYAWVLMSNHYHLVIKTPEANLVQAMTWFQNTWTRRFNARHRLWGHLFGGRYKSIPVQETEYLTTLIHYVHLNPVRAALLKKSEAIESYPWGSLADYVKPKRKRRSWVAVDDGLAQAGFEDTARGRRKFLECTERLVNWNKPHEAGIEFNEGQSLHSTLRRGWYFGAETFRERLLAQLVRSNQDSVVELRRKGYSGEQTRDHAKKDAERIIKVAAKTFGILDREWVRMKKGDWRKGVIAGLIREQALVDNGWVAERLHMGARGAVSRSIGEATTRAKSDRKTRRLVHQIRQNVKSF